MGYLGLSWKLYDIMGFEEFNIILLWAGVVLPRRPRTLLTKKEIFWSTLRAFCSLLTGFTKHVLNITWFRTLTTCKIRSFVHT